MVFGWGKSEKTEETSTPAEDDFVPIKKTPEPKVQSSITITQKDTNRFSWLKPLGKLPNPGKFEEINFLSKEILEAQETFDGFRFEIQRGISDSFATGHAFSLGSASEPPNSSFTATYNRRNFFMVGRIDKDLRQMGKCGLDLGSTYIVTSAQNSSEPNERNLLTEVTHTGDDYVGQIKWAYPLTFTVGYMQSITNRLSMGCEGMYQHHTGYSYATYGARYEADRYACTIVGTGGLLSLGYTHKVLEKPNLQNSTNSVRLSTELNFQPSQYGGLDSSWAVGLQYKLTSSNFKARLDSNWKVTAIMEENMNPAMRVGLCAELDHPKKEYRFGLGIILQS